MRSTRVQQFEGRPLDEPWAYLREQLQHGRRFDAVVLDPPKFAGAAQAERAARAYKDSNRLGLMLPAPVTARRT